MNKIKFKKIRYWHYSQEIQEHYLNLKYQFSEQQAYNYLCLVNIAPALLHLIIGQITLEILGSSLRKAKLI